MGKKQHIINSINNADLGISKLTNKILNLEGLSSYKIRHLLNNLLELDDVNYLEIGTWKGSTLTSALFNNKVKNVYAIDNWSEFDKSGEVKKQFLKNTKDFNFEFFEEDCYSIKLEQITHPINIFLYDGAHDYDSHYNALTYFYPVLADQFIFIVDDFDPVPSWQQVEKATRDSIRDLKLKIIYEKHIPSNGRNDKNSWWNGYYVSLLKK